MIKIATGYGFVASTGVVTLNGINLPLDNILLIVDDTQGVIIYSPAQTATKAASYSQGTNSTLTLNWNTSGYSNSDALTIKYDDGVYVLPVSNVSSISTVTPTITAGAYTAGWEVGGLMTFTNVVRGTSGVLQSIWITSKSAQTTPFKLYLFNANPSNSTWTDHAVTTTNINAADVSKLIGVYTLGSFDSGLGVHTIYTLDGIAKDFVLSSGTSLYGVLVCINAFTPASTSDLVVNINVLED